MLSTPRRLHRRATPSAAQRVVWLTLSHAEENQEEEGAESEADEPLPKRQRTEADIIEIDYAPSDQIT